jgi:phosphatidylserine decarboxylase
MKIHRQGHKIIFIIFCVYSIILFIVFNYIKNPVVSSVISILLVFSFLFVIWFFRAPKRAFRNDENLVYAPADGKVVAVEEITEEEYFKDTRIQISIFMSPLNVHVNYYPVSGTIEYIKYHKGKYLVAWHPKSSTLNERATIVIKSVNNKIIMVRQIAGAVARRILTNAVEGESVKQGDELGFIRFGSRVDLVLPAGTKILTSINNKVRGKKTVIAEIGTAPQID